MKQSKEQISREVALEEMMKRAKYTQKVKNYTPEKSVLEGIVEEAWSKLQAEDVRLEAEARERGDDYLPLFLSPKRGVRLVGNTKRT
jgi:hypothetical protein